MQTYLKISSFHPGKPVHNSHLGVDPGDPTKVYHDRPAPAPDDPGAWEEVALTLHDNGAFDVLFKQANVQLSVDQYGVPTTRPAGTFGTDEQFYATDQPDGSHLLYRFQDGVLVPVALIIEVIQ